MKRMGNGPRAYLGAPYILNSATSEINSEHTKFMGEGEAIQDHFCFMMLNSHNFRINVMDERAEGEAAQGLYEKNQWKAMRFRGKAMLRRYRRKLAQGV